MRRRVVFAVGVGVSIAAGFIACGIDESGTADGGGKDATSGDAPPIDAPIDVVIDVPQGCKTLDATACVDADVPDGWTYAVIKPGDQICPTTVDYDNPTLFLQNPQPQGGCTCSCTTSGSVDCSGHLEAGSGGGCTDPNKQTAFDAGNDAACIVTNWNDTHYAIPAPPTSSANVHCDAGVASLGGWKADTITSCAPKCSADFCNVGNTYKRCVLGSGPSCPAPFTQMQLPFGIDSGVGTSCTGCGCSVVTSGQCAAVIQPFNGTSCDTANDDASVANGVCNASAAANNINKVNSFMYTPIVPDAGCVPTAGSPGAAFVSSVTVCCLP